MFSFLLTPFINIALNAGVLYVLARVVDGISYTGGYKFLVLGGLVLGFINFIIKPILKAFSMPFVFLTAGLFYIAINVILLYLLQYFLNVIDFQDVALTIDGASSYLVGAIVFGLLNFVTSLFSK